MKFRDGYWEIKPGIRSLNPAALWDARIEDHSLTIYSACRPIKHRSDTMGAPLLTTVFSSPLPDVIRVRTYHHQGRCRRFPVFQVPEDRYGRGEIEEDGCRFSSGELSVRITKTGGWKTAFVRQGKELTEIIGKTSGHYTGPGDETWMVQYLSLGVGETVYGLGERFTSLVKNGQAVDIWNEDGGTASDQSYKNIPFYITSKGYGVFVADPGKVSFEVASELVGAVQFSLPGEEIDYYIIAGDTLKAVLAHYTALTGRPALPPAWSFGLWLTTSFTTKYDEATVNHFIQGMADRRIPLQVFHFDCFWMKAYQWFDGEWDRDQFPDPVAMLSRLKSRGLKICLWINPYIGQRSALFDEGMAKGFLVKRENGDIWQWDRWQSGMALVDFTHPEAAAWYQGVLKKLLDMGVDTFKTDFGERIPTDVRYADGSDPHKMHNYYTFLYNKTVFELLERERGRGDALVFARSATAGGQRFPVHWGGDCSASYPSMAESLRGGLSLSLSGFAFWSHDISGFENTATPDLFKRWTAFGLLSTHSRLHGNASYRVPWNFDDEASEVLRFFTELKCRLMPYLFNQALTAAREGIPLMRAMILEFTADPACAYLDRQYMLGDSLLVAPIFAEDGRVSYYLPSGRWINFLTGQEIAGGLWREEWHDYFSIPLMVRPGSIIPVGAYSQGPVYEYADHICFHIFDPPEGPVLRHSVPDAAGEIALEITLTRKDGLVRVRREKHTGKPWNLFFRGIREGCGVRDREGVSGRMVGPADTRAAGEPAMGFLVTLGPRIDEVEVALG